MKNGKPALTNLDKLYWPKEKITKGDLVHYYETIAPFILPYLKNRPLSLKRNPNGILDEGFYHKDAGDIAPAWIKTADIHAVSSDKTIHYLVCNDVKSLLFIANLGCIEMNPWNSTVTRLDHPDYLVMDIDPSEKNTFDQVIETALVLKNILDAAGINGYCKTSGASGLHVYIPCNKKYEYDRVRDFAKILATWCRNNCRKLPRWKGRFPNVKKTRFILITCKTAGVRPWHQFIVQDQSRGQLFLPL